MDTAEQCGSICHFCRQRAAGGEEHTQMRTVATSDRATAEPVNSCSNMGLTRLQVWFGPVQNSRRAKA
jgi:hypothetical protein